MCFILLKLLVSSQGDAISTDCNLGWRAHGQTLCRSRNLASEAHMVVVCVSLYWIFPSCWKLNFLNLFLFPISAQTERKFLHNTHDFVPDVSISDIIFISRDRHFVSMSWNWGAVLAPNTGHGRKQSDDCKWTPKQLYLHFILFLFRFTQPFIPSAVNFLRSTPQIRFVNETL